MLHATEVSAAQLDQEAGSLGLVLPIEQTAVWMEYESTIPDRAYWGSYIIYDDEAPMALVSFMDYKAHGYHYLRAHHGPVYVSGPGEEQEEQVAQLLRSLVRKKDSKVAFIRMGILHDIPQSRPVLSTRPYDTTVFIDLADGDEDEILARFKARGRRDVRKALRETGAQVIDETAQATQDFSEYYKIMEETGERDGFTPAPLADYQNMLEILGPDHARLFASRIDGDLISWSIDTIQGNLATRYYAASRRGPMRGVPDQEVYESSVALGKLGCTSRDLMGIGSDFSPTLLDLNKFKTKFSNETVAVAPDRDLPVKDLFYKGLVAVKHLRDGKEA